MAKKDDLSTMKWLNKLVEKKKDFSVTEPTNISSFLSREEDEGTQP
jgi:hypothetical protein